MKARGSRERVDSQGVEAGEWPPHQSLSIHHARLRVSSMSGEASGDEGIALYLSLLFWMKSFFLGKAYHQI